MRIQPARRPRRRLPDPLLHLRRHPRTRRAIAIALLATAALLVQRSWQAGDAERARWGRSTEVAVATRDLRAGEVLSDAAVELRDVPLALVPEGAISSPSPPRSVREPIYRGEIVIAARLAPDGLSGTAALVPEGQRAVAIPLAPGVAPPVNVGDRVDVLVALATPGGAGPPGFAVASGAEVLDVGQETITVAVEREEAAKVAVAVAQGLVTLALIGG